MSKGLLSFYFYWDLLPFFYFFFLQIQYKKNLFVAFHKLFRALLSRPVTDNIHFKTNVKLDRKFFI